MKFPGYPSNREADVSTARNHCESGKVCRRMKPSRETCLHRDTIIPLGVGYAIWLMAFSAYADKDSSLFSVPQGGTLFYYKKAPLATSFDQK